MSVQVDHKIVRVWSVRANPGVDFYTRIINDDGKGWNKGQKHNNTGGYGNDKRQNDENGERNDNEKKNKNK